MEKNLNLTRKQKRFIDEYLIDCNATQAAIRAGYSQKTASAQGSKLFAIPEIAEAIEERLELIRSKKIAEATEVLEYLTAVMRGEHTEQALQLVGDGVQQITDIEVSAKDRLRAAELIGKRYGMFNDKFNVEAPIPIIIDGADELED